MLKEKLSELIEKSKNLKKEKEKRIQMSNSLKIKKSWQKEKNELKKAKEVATHKVAMLNRGNPAGEEEYTEAKDSLKFLQNRIRHILWRFIG